jgi:hypothetical protein
MFIPNCDDGGELIIEYERNVKSLETLVPMNSMTSWLGPKIVLTEEQLDAWAAKHKPPQSWYESPEEDLFS